MGASSTVSTGKLGESDRYLATGGVSERVTGVPVARCGFEGGRGTTTTNGAATSFFGRGGGLDATSWPLTSSSSSELVLDASERGPGEAERAAAGAGDGEGSRMRLASSGFGLVGVRFASLATTVWPLLVFLRAGSCTAGASSSLESAAAASEQRGLAARHGAGAESSRFDFLLGGPVGETEMGTPRMDGRVRACCDPDAPAGAARGFDRALSWAARALLRRLPRCMSRGAVERTLSRGGVRDDEVDAP